MTNALPDTQRRENEQKLNRTIMYLSLKFFYCAVINMRKLLMTFSICLSLNIKEKVASSRWPGTSGVVHPSHLSSTYSLQKHF